MAKPGPSAGRRYAEGMPRGLNTDTAENILYGRYSRKTALPQLKIPGATDPALYVGTNYHQAMLDVWDHEKTLSLSGRVRRIAEGTIADGRRLIVVDKVTALGLGKDVSLYHLWHADIGATEVRRENGHAVHEDGIELKIETAVGDISISDLGSRPKFNGFDLQPLI